MKKSLFRSTLTLLLVAATAGASFAGAWTSPKNGFYEKLSYNYYYAHQSFNPNGGRHETANDGSFTDHNITNYLEFGITDDLTAINSLTYKWLRNEDNATLAKGHGLGDVDLGLRYKLSDSGYGILSSQLLVKIPGSYSKNDPLPLGNDQVDVEARVLYGLSLYPFVPGYGNLELGYRWRDGDPSDELRYLVEIGFDLGKNVYTRAKLDGITSLDNGKKFDGSGNPTATNNFDLGKLDLALGYQVTKNWGVELSYVPALYGQNTAAGATYSVGAYYKSP
jgi:protein XagA